MTDTNQIEKLISDKGLKKCYIAEELGLSSYGFMKKVNNVTEFKPSEIVKLCELLGVDTAEDRERLFFRR